MNLDSGLENVETLEKFKSYCNKLDTSHTLERMVKENEYMKLIQLDVHLPNE